MSTSVSGYLSSDEARQLRAQVDSLATVASSGVPPSRFHFLANFDGTHNDKDNLRLSGSPYQTNIANIYDQAKTKEDDYFRTQYYPGVGTGGINGGALSAGPVPTPAMRQAATQAYQDFVQQSRVYLATHPDATYRDISASVTGFSRGAVTAVMFAQMVDEKGLELPNGKQIAPPHAIPIKGMALLDPVATGVQGDIALPGNVQGRVLVVKARDEHRSEFRFADYSQDKRVLVAEIPGNHCGVGGGYDQSGTAAAARELATNYLRNSGLDIAPAPEGQRFDPGQRAPVYSEAYNVHYARNGDEMGTPDNPVLAGDKPAHPDVAWPVDPGQRQGTPVPVHEAAPRNFQERSAGLSEQERQARAPRQGGQPASPKESPRPNSKPNDPRDPKHPEHAMYQSVSEQLAALNGTRGIVLSPQQLDNCSAAIMTKAREVRIRSVNHMEFSADVPPTRVVFSNGDPDHPASKINSTDMAQAIKTPAEQSFLRFEQNTQAFDQWQQQMRQQRQAQEQSQGLSVQQ